MSGFAHVLAALDGPGSKAPLHHTPAHQCFALCSILMPRGAGTPLSHTSSFKWSSLVPAELPVNAQLSHGRYIENTASDLANYRPGEVEG